MKKDIKFSTRMASADREKIRALAQKAGMSMSDYVTACCLGKRIVVMDGLKEVLRQQKSHRKQSQPAGGAGEYGQGTVRQFGFCCVNSRQERPINIYDCNTSSTRYK